RKNVAVAAAKLELAGQIVRNNTIKFLAHEPAGCPGSYPRNDHAGRVVQCVMRVREPPGVVPSDCRPFFRGLDFQTGASVADILPTYLIIHPERVMAGGLELVKSTSVTIFRIVI